MMEKTMKRDVQTPEDVKAYRGDLDKPLGRAVIWYNSECTRTSQDGWIPKEEARKSLKPKKG